MFNLEIINVGEKDSKRIVIVDFIGNDKLFDKIKKEYIEDGNTVFKIFFDSIYIDDEVANDLNKHLLKEEYDLVIPILDNRSKDLLEDSAVEA